MFITDKLTYIQLQKTGCTHIAHLLKRLYGGEQVGKHNAPASAEIDSGMFYLASVRNPWDWYLSLWTFGVQGHGDLRGRLTGRKTGYYLRQLKESPLSAYKGLLLEFRKDRKAWNKAYADGSDPEAFRTWLKLILDPVNAKFLGEGYGESDISKYCGFMTYRYLYLCCKDHEKLTKLGFSDFESVKSFDKKNCYINSVIRQENLESDLIDILQERFSLNNEQKNIIINAKKTNTSKRSLKLSDYYDKETVDLVAKKESLINKKFGYSSKLVFGM